MKTTRAWTITLLALLLAGGMAVTPALGEPLPNNRHIFINVANDAGVFYNWDSPFYGGPNNTYYIKADGGGLNELHLTNDPAELYGQVTFTNQQSGTFYLSNTGGRGFDNGIILMIAVNGTVPDDFAVHIRSSGYRFTPAPQGNTTPDAPTDYYYVDGAVDETFTKADFIYGPQIWKPGPGILGDTSLQIYDGQDMTDTGNTFRLMFVDLDVGNLEATRFPEVTLVDEGAAKVEYSFSGLNTFASFAGYGWCSAANQGQGISWTNRPTGYGASGYSVIGTPGPEAPVAGFTGVPTSGQAPLPVQFTDSSTGSPTAWAWDFNNDGVIDSTAQNPSYIYANAGTYSVNFTATNAGGSSSKLRSNYITVSAAPPAPPVAGFTGAPTSGQAPLTVQFTDSSTGSPTSWAWDFNNDGVIDSTVQNPSYSYANAGTYSVNLTATNAGGSSSKLSSNYITVSSAPPAPPVAGFTGAPTSGQAPLTVQFTDSSTGSPTSWKWDFNNDGVIDSTVQNPSYTYANTGTYSVNLTATNAGGINSKLRSNYITVSSAPPAPPVAGFTGAPTSGQAPLTVQFTDSSTGSPTSWKWDFNNDGVIDSTAQNPSYTYANAGTYSVNLTATNAGGSNSKLRSNYITVSGSGVLPGYNNIFVRVANEDGAKYDVFSNDTYNIRFEGIDRGLNALHISTDPSENFGQVTLTGSQSGTFYATDSGGKGYEDDIILLVAVNGTIPDNFALHITSDGYTWTPNPESNMAPPAGTPVYQPVALDETFTADDFIYGPQIWKPTGNEVDYPIYAGQDMSDTGNTFRLMFVDLNSGVLRPNSTLQNQGAVRINYAFENPGSFAAFSVYGYCRNSNNGDDMVAWTNALVAPKAVSGYAVVRSEAPVTVFDGSPRSGTAPLTVQFNDHSSGAPTSWSWAFGDGGTSDEQNPSHTYGANGTYQVSLTVTNAAGSDSETKPGYITVSAPLPEPPVVNFIAGNRTGPAPLVVHFIDESTNTPTSWKWDFENDGIIDSTEQNPTHTYQTPGTYQVNLTASNAAGSAYRLKGNYIQVTSPMGSLPVVDFSANPRTGTAPFTVQFTDLTVTDPSSWKWDFENDGDVDSTLQNPSHTFVTPGTYAVNLTATNESGTASRLKASYIMVTSPEAPPVAGFTASPTSGNAPLTVQFTDSSTGSPTSWKWDFNNDGVIDSTVQNPSYTYATAGTYSVNFTATNAGGSSSKLRSGYISVTGSGGGIVAAFTGTPLEGTAPLEVQFTDRSTGNPLYYLWSFGDGTPYSSASNPRHTYTTGGTYTVTLKVTSLSGTSSATRSDYITVAGKPAPAAPVAAFSVVPKGGASPHAFQFVDRSTGNPMYWLWSFGDGTPYSSAKNPVHSFGNDGTYRVTLTVTSMQGVSSATDEVTIQD